MRLAARGAGGGGPAWPPRPARRHARADGRHVRRPRPSPTTSVTGSASPTVATGGRDGGPFLQPCGSRVRSSLDEPQAIVEFFVRAPADAAGHRRLSCGACSMPLATVRRNGRRPDAWTPVVLADRPAARRSTTSSISARRGRGVDIDDVSFSPVRPAGHDDQRRAAVRASASTHPLGGSSRCASTAARSCRCTSPFSPAGLAPGTHTLRAAAVDVYGRVDADARDDRRSPSRRRRRRADGDGDGVPDATRQLPGRRQQRPGRRRQGRRRRRLRRAAARQRAAGRGRRPRRAAALGRGVRQAARPQPSSRQRLHPAQGRRLDPARLDRRRAQGRDRDASRRPTATRPPTGAPSSSGADQGRHLRDQAEAREEGRGQEDASIATDVGAAQPARRRGRRASGPAEGHRALGVDGRQGLLPHDRRREHRHRRTRPSPPPTAATAR